MKTIPAGWIETSKNVFSPPQAVEKKRIRQSDKPLLNQLERNLSDAEQRKINRDCSLKKEIDSHYQGDNVSEMPIPYSESEDAQILKFYKERGGLPVDLDELSSLLGRSRWSVAMRASRLGVTESDRPKTESHKIKCSESQRNRVRTDEETERASRRQKEYITKHGHPKGFKGHKRTDKEIDGMRDASRNAWADPGHKLNSREHRNILSDRMSKMASERSSENSFSRSKYGKRADLGEVFFRSAWEANYARYLNFLINSEGKIKRWEFEAETFWFDKIKRGCRSYKPDFKVFFLDGTIEYHEVKGWMYPRSKTALKRMKKYHPDIRVVLIDQLRYRAIAKQVCKIIKGWE